MRILHVVASYLPAVRYGGTIVSVHGLCRALAARGHDVHVYTTSVDGPADSDVAHGEPLGIDGVQVWYFRSRHLRRLYWSPPLGGALRERVHEFAIVHTHAIFLWPLWAAARAARRAGVPYLVSPRGMLEKGLIERKAKLAKSAWIALVERRNLEGAAGIHVTSHREATEALAFGFDLPAISEVPNGVDLVSAAGDLPSSAIRDLCGLPFVLFLGRINWKKGLDRLLSSLVAAPAVRLVVAGNDEDGYRARLEQQATALGVADRVTFVGPVHGADKAALLRSARILVLPSYSENFGNVALEAMAAGCAVVVTPEVGIADIVTRTGAGWVVDGTPAAVLGARLNELVNDAAGCAAAGARGRAAVEREFTWDCVAEQMAAVYEKTIAQARGRRGH